MLQLKTSIDKVNIYRSGAEVYRRGSIDLSEGQHTLAVCGLSESVRLDTVRLFSGEGISCSNQRFEKPTGSDTELESDRIRNEIESLNGQIEVKNLQAELWKANGDFTNRTSQSPSEIQEYIDMLPERLDRLNSDITELRAKITKLEKELEKAEQDERKPVLAVDISVKKEGTYPFEVRYYEASAGWSPVYELHTDSKEPVELKMRARIRQNSGEDWKNIGISLFSGNPSTSGTLPNIGPVYLNIQEEVKAKARNAAFGMMESKAAAPMAANAFMMMDMDEAALVETEEAEVSSEETMTEYMLPGRRDIFTGSEGTMADLQKYTLNTEYAVVTVPCLDPAAYLIATVRTEDIPFSSGISTAVYLNDMYTGQVVISPDLTKETLEITLGKEEHIHVGRREVLNKTSTTLFKGQKVVEHGFETKITNYSGSDIEITVKDQIPVSQDKEITVDVKDLSGASLEAETGLLTKKLTVPAGKTETLALSYKVNWPKDKRIRETKSIVNKWCPVCGAKVFGRFCPECGSAVN